MLGDDIRRHVQFRGKSMVRMDLGSRNFRAVVHPAPPTRSIFWANLQGAYRFGLSRLLPGNADGITITRTQNKPTALEAVQLAGSGSSYPGPWYLSEHLLLSA